MKTKHILFLIGALILIAACKKNEYSNTSTSNQPVFYFNGAINNSPVLIQAGVNNYNMNTSYSKDTNGVYDFTGLFTIPGSPSNCPNSLKFYFKDYRQYSIYPTTIDSLITPGYYDYATPAGEPTGFYVTLVYYFNQVPIDTNWNFGDGQTGKVRIHYYYHPGIYNVSLAINSASCTTYDTNTVLVGEVGNAFLTPFSNNAFKGLQTQFSAVPNAGIPPYRYTWNYGDPISGAQNTYSNTSVKDTGTHDFTGVGVYPVSVTTTDATGYTAVYRSTIATPGATGCAGGFFEWAQTPYPNPYNLNDVGIEWYDAGGNLWKSENNHQHSKALFQVSSVAEYKTNSLGQATKIINANVSCELYHGTDSIPLTGNVVFGVAHF